MASKQELTRAEKLIGLFNAGAKVYNPGDYVATLEIIDDDEYVINLNDGDGDYVDTFSSVSEFSNWIEDEESGYVD